MLERGRTLDSVVQQYMATVRPMHAKYVEPSKEVADMIIPEGYNNVALDMILNRLHNYVERSKKLNIWGSSRPGSHSKLSSLVGSDSRSQSPAGFYETKA